MSLEARPLTLRAAAAYINTLHRHHVAPRGWKFGIAAYEGEKMVGVVTVGRPVARGNDDGFTAEVNRLCTDGTKNAPSFLYAAAWRAARAMGYRRLITYILAEEPGTTLKAAGWKLVGSIKGKSWDTPSRARTDKHPTTDKMLFEVTATPPSPPQPKELCECGHRKATHDMNHGACPLFDCPCTAFKPAQAPGSIFDSSWSVTYEGKVIGVVTDLEKTQPHGEGHGKPAQRCAVCGEGVNGLQHRNPVNETHRFHPKPNGTGTKPDKEEEG